jgi:glutamine amidotransferase
MSGPITMIDYGGSNLRSVQKAFEAVGAMVAVTADPQTVAQAAKLVLPGVGAFGAGMAALRARGLDEAVSAAVARGAWLLGICLGMQFLFDESEEMGRHAGLGLLPGRVVRFPAGALKVPHVGWNEIEPRVAHPLLIGLPPGAHAYFVHSYLCVPARPDDVLATADYGGPFAAIVGRGRVCGLQFHPEKSQRVGLGILRNFAMLEGNHEL